MPDIETGQLIVENENRKEVYNFKGSGDLFSSVNSQTLAAPLSPDETIKFFAGKVMTADLAAICKVEGTPKMSNGIFEANKVMVITGKAIGPDSLNRARETTQMGAEFSGLSSQVKFMKCTP